MEKRPFVRRFAALGGNLHVMPNAPLGDIAQHELGVTLAALQKGIEQLGGRLCTSGVFTIFTSSVLSRAMMASGVPAGAKTPCHAPQATYLPCQTQDVARSHCVTRLHAA